MKNLFYLLFALPLLFSCGPSVESVEQLKEYVSDAEFKGLGVEVAGKPHKSFDKKVKFNADGTYSEEWKNLRTDKVSKKSGKWEAKKCKYRANGGEFFYIKRTNQSGGESYLVWHDGFLREPYSMSNESSLLFTEMDGCLYCLEGDVKDNKMAEQWAKQ